MSLIETINLHYVKEVAASAANVPLGFWEFAFVTAEVFNARRKAKHSSLGEEQTRVPPTGVFGSSRQASRPPAGELALEKIALPILMPEHSVEKLLSTSRLIER
jgi:hypothetical protein